MIRMKPRMPAQNRLLMRDYKAISRKAGNPPVINTKEGKELTAGIHRMWQSITGNKGEMKHAYVI